MAINNQWPSERATSKKRTGMYSVDVFSNLDAQVSLLTKQLQATQLQNMQVSANAVQACTPLCEFCNDLDLSLECQVGNPFEKMTMEKAQHLGEFSQIQPQFNPFSNTYNSG